MHNRDIDNQPDEPSGRCDGTRHHKCGRFCGRAYSCPRCEAEIEAEWRADMAAELMSITTLLGEPLR